jgi:hypothetical protein
MHYINELKVYGIERSEMMKRRKRMEKNQERKNDFGIDGIERL